MSRLNVMRLQLGVAALLLITVASCGEKEAADETTKEQARGKRYTVPEELDRELNENELDSLQQMKRTHRITRDEYWDGYGGVFANDEVEVWYPDGKISSIQGMAMLKRATIARARTKEVFGTVPAERPVIICAGDIDSYMSSTGRQWWQYSRIVGDTISVQPPVTLYTRGLLDVVGPREYYEWAIGKLSQGHAPRWVEEGFASYLSGEASILEDLRMDFGTKPLAMSARDMESALVDEKDRQDSRRAYYNAYRTVEAIVKAHGEAAMGRFVVTLGENDDKDAAARAAFGTDFDTVVEAGRAWTQEL